MLEKGTILRRLLCLWGWHHWTKYQEKRMDHAAKAVLPSLALLASALILVINAVAHPDRAFGPVGLTLWSATFILSLIVLPSGWSHCNGPFDGICIYCHKHVTNYTDWQNKIKEDTEYEAMLTEIAQDAYDEQGLPRPVEDDDSTELG